jgi:tetratricopeptide (TPR) repeat protein
MTGAIEALIREAEALRALGSPEKARASYAAAADLSHALAALLREAHALRHVSDLDRAAGDAGEALAAAEQAIGLYRLEGSDALGLANALRLKALALVSLGQAAAARPVWAEAADRYAALGVGPGATECRAHADA